MDEINIGNLKKLVNKIIDIVLDEDLKEGHKLLQLCAEYEVLNINNNIYNCAISNHKQQVVVFIEKIISRYSNLINFYNILKGFNSSKNNNIDCRSLNNYVAFLEKIKILKEEIDGVESLNEIKNILK